MLELKRKFKEDFPKTFKCFRTIYHMFYGKWSLLKETILISGIAKKHRRALLNAKGKRTLRCVFMAVHYQTWKYDNVYKIMSQCERFEPIILICPSVNFGKEKMLMHLNESYDFFLSKGYNVKCSYDSINDKYIDLAKEIKPDILFYTNPYKGLIDDRYFITNFTDYLTIYVPYAFNNNIDFKFCHDLLLHNVVWRYYAESEEHLGYSIKHARCKGRNVVISGYPGIESLIDNHSMVNSDFWKNGSHSFKRIIWAPHHTIKAVGKVNYSCFIRYCDFMLELANKYKDKVQFVFKPHPLLKDKLDVLWGKEKADDYYNKWKYGVNTNLDDGDYIDLFISSDAMIHDSGSFLIEYLYVNKPVMRTLNDIPLNEMYNSFALKCLEQYYFANKQKDIEQFVENVINDVDPLREQRTKFVNEVLMPKGSPSQNIIDDILDSIDNQILYRN